MRHLSLIVLLFLGNTLKAQEVLWATKVLEYSSEITDLTDISPKFKAIQVLGKPSVMPQGGYSACAWQPVGSTYGEDYIKVGYETAIKIKQIIIAENINAGSIARIFGYSTTGEELLLYENNNSPRRLQSRITNIIVPETSVPIGAVKVLLVHDLVKEIKQIDAIGISSSDQPAILDINVAKDIPEELEKENLGSMINSKFSEVGPIVSPDGKSLYFTRLNHPDNIPSDEGKIQDIWISQLQENGQWGIAQNLKEPINNAGNNAAATISGDGNKLFVLNTYGKGPTKAGLSKAIRRGNRWRTPTAINMADFQAEKISDGSKVTGRIVTEYSISTDEKVLIMSLKRKPTYGDNDLYVAFKIDSESYSKPINLGNVLNTAANEGSPFLAADKKTLYFNSSGHPGYGDADIYVTTRLDDTWMNWSEPVNLGSKINSKEWDGFISIPASGEYAYFSSDKNSIGAEDIFKIKLFPSIQPAILYLLNFKFKNKADGQIVSGNVHFDVIDSEKEHATNTDQVSLNYDEETKTYSVILKAGSDYELRAEFDSIPNFSEKIMIKNLKKYEEAEMTFEVGEFVPNKSQEIENLYFDQSSAIIKEESYTALEKLKKMLLDNPLMEILLEGHTDNQGDMVLNIQLAKSRVEAVRKYLIADGQIIESRIQIKAWGPYRPNARNTSEELRKKNRRVEFSVLKM